MFKKFNHLKFEVRYYSGLRDSILRKFFEIRYSAYIISCKISVVLKLVSRRQVFRSTTSPAHSPRLRQRENVSPRACIVKMMFQLSINITCEKIVRRLTPFSVEPGCFPTGYMTLVGKSPNLGHFCPLLRRDLRL